MSELKVGQKWRGKEIYAVRPLSNGWHLIKTPNGKSKGDFRVRTVFSIKPQRSTLLRHAHIAIDLYGKLCADCQKGRQVLDAIVEVWHQKGIEQILNKYKEQVSGLPGYSLEYIPYALAWILEQEDVNFTGRSDKKQAELDQICQQRGVKTPRGRKGSQLAISLLCDIANDTHPVEALLKVGLDIKPRWR